LNMSNNKQNKILNKHHSTNYDITTTTIISDIRKLTEGAHTTWIDNFSKVYAAGLQGILTPSYAECLWTGVAIRPYAGSKVFDLHPDHQVTDDCMPEDLFDDGIENRLFKLVENQMQSCVKRNDDGDVRMMEKSWCVRMKVNSVPLKPHVNEVDSKYLRRVLNESRDGMTFFRPQAILPHNIGSNRGLLQILRDRMDVYANNKADGKPRLDIINSDPNIFARIIKVWTMTTDECYDMPVIL
jgi:hypothetical protein